MAPNNCTRHWEARHIFHTDAGGNTHQDRVVNSDKRFLMIKNFPSHRDLLEAITRLGHAATANARDPYRVFLYTANQQPKVATQMKLALLLSKAVWLTPQLSIVPNEL